MGLDARAARGSLQAVLVLPQLLSLSVGMLGILLLSRISSVHGNYNSNDKHG